MTRDDYRRVESWLYSLAHSRKMVAMLQVQISRLENELPELRARDYSEPYIQNASAMSMQEAWVLKHHQEIMLWHSWKRSLKEHQDKLDLYEQVISTLPPVCRKIAEAKYFKQWSKRPRRQDIMLEAGVSSLPTFDRYIRQIVEAFYEVLDGRLRQRTVRVSLDTYFRICEILGRNEVFIDIDTRKQLEKLAWCGGLTSDDIALLSEAGIV